MPANKLAESKRVAGEVGGGGQAKLCSQGPAGAVGKFLFFYMLFHVFFILHIFVFQRALFGVYAHFRFLYSIFINIFTECYDPTAGNQHTMLGPKGLLVKMK